MAFQWITTQEQLRLLLPTAADVKLEFLAAYFQRAEFQLLRPWLGQATLDEIYQAPAEPPAAVAELLALLRPAVASYGYRIYTGEGQQVLTGNGPRRLATPDQKPLNPEELTKHLAELERSAYAQLDEALVLLEEHPEQFTAWHGSRFSTILAGHFFDTADALNKYAQGDITRIRFRRLWPAINAAELHYIRPLLGRKLLERLLDEQEDTRHSEVVDLVRTAVAGLVIEDDIAHEAAHVALDELRDLLNHSLEEYPEFESSAAYEPPILPNDQSNNFYAFY